MVSERRNPYHYLDIVTMAHLPIFVTEFHEVVQWVRRADSIQADICRASVTYPVSRERPFCTFPHIIRPQSLQPNSRIITLVRGSVKSGVVYNRRAFVSKKLIGKEVKECTVHLFGKGAIDGEAGFVEYGGDEDGLAHRRERGGRVERGRY